MSTDRFDVAIIGAGPAGATAAAFLAGRERRIALIDAADFKSSQLQAAWLSARAIPIFEELGINTARTLKSKISEITFSNADFSKSSQARFDQPAGYLVGRESVGKLLREAAIAAGAVFRPGAAVTEIRLNETDLVLSLKDQSKLTSRLLIVATGSEMGLVSRLGFRPDEASAGLWTAQVDGEAGDRTAPAKVCIVLGLEGGSGFSWCGTWENRAVVNVTLPQHRDQAVQHLQRICKLGHQHGAIPVDLSESAASTIVHRIPAGRALDMETHVAKHSLLVGEAGGFISAANNEGLYPAMWSAKLAAETAEEALRSKYSQDALMSFDAKWRMQMADYLRSPHTDIRFLLPLIFSNQPMADRMGAAFLLGSNM